MSDTDDVQPVAPQSKYSQFLATVLFLACVAAGIAVGVRAGRAAYHLLCQVWGSEEVVYGYCYRFDGEQLNCQPGVVTVEPGDHVPNFGCYSECFRRETPYVFQKVPMFGDYPVVLLVGTIVGVITAIIAAIIVALLGEGAWEAVMDRVKRRRESRGDGYGY